MDRESIAPRGHSGYVECVASRTAERAPYWLALNVPATTCRQVIRENESRMKSNANPDSADTSAILDERLLSAVTPPTRVALVSDEAVLCAGLAELMRTVPDLQWVGYASDARSAFQFLARVLPEVVLMDVPLPGMDGISATRELRWRVPRARVLMFSRMRERDVVLALEAGAQGFALKSEPFGALLDAIRCVAQGHRYLAPELRDQPLFGRPPPRGQPGRAGVLARLSPRELEVVRLLVRGWNSERVAQELCLSRKTVCTHRTRIYRKLGCHSICELVRLAAADDMLSDGA